MLSLSSSGKSNSDSFDNRLSTYPESTSGGERAPPNPVIKPYTAEIPLNTQRIRSKGGLLFEYGKGLELKRFHEFLGFGDQGLQFAVGLHKGHVPSVGAVDVGYFGGDAFGAPEIQRLGGIQQFNGQNPLRVFDHFQGFDGGVGAHAHVVFLSVGRVDGIHRRGGAQLLVFADDGRGGVLGNHEAGIQPRIGDEKCRKIAQAVDQLVGSSLRNTAQLRHRDRHEIQGDRQGLAVEIPRRYDGVFVGQDRKSTRLNSSHV